MTKLTASLQSRHLANREVPHDGPLDIPHDSRRLLVTPLAAGRQQAGKVSTLGILNPHPSPSPEQRGRRPFSAELKELGWVDGQNLKIEPTYGGGREDRLPELAGDLVRRHVDVIRARDAGGGDNLTGRGPWR